MGFRLNVAQGLRCRTHTVQKVRGERLFYGINWSIFGSVRPEIGHFSHPPQTVGSVTLHLTRIQSSPKTAILELELVRMQYTP